MTLPSLLTTEYRVKKIRTLEDVPRSLSLFGKIVFYALVVLFAGSAVTLLAQVNKAFLVDIPRTGGTVTEGVVGLPRFINPVLAVTDGDKDISALVYSGLMRYEPGNMLVPDLAESYDISPDGKIYTFTLRRDATFHDGTPVTADDVEFTIRKIQDRAIKSVKFANWDGVAVEKIGQNQIKFTLRQAYSPFLENTTVGILPKHLWKDISAEEFPFSNLNAKPVGSGPYKIGDTVKNSDNIPTAYILRPFENYAQGKPSINSIVVKFYPTEKALIQGFIDGEIDAVNGISPDIASSLEETGVQPTQSALPRVFGVFFNQGKNEALAEKPVRQALSMSANRDHIAHTVLQGYATTLTEPVPQEFSGLNSRATTTPYDERVASANKLLDMNGWKLNADGIREKKTKKGTTTLSFSMTTSDSSELKQVADILREEWKRIGASVDIKVFEGGYLNQSVIKPRNYDALLFGQIVNRDLDLYAFWHSSQKEDPGLNIALYNNPKADTFLERIRSTSDANIRKANYEKFQSEVDKDIPAVFLYSPNLIYVVPRQVKNLSTGAVSTPSERFGNVHTWYIDTDKVWKIFVRK